MRGSCYDVLGIAQSSSDAEIRLRYLQLMRRYHPDHNQSPLAQVRSAEINEAYRILSEPQLRAGHNAHLTAKRQDVISARVPSYSSDRSGTALVRRRPPSPLKQYGAGLAFAALLSGTGVIGWQIQQRLPGSDVRAIGLPNSQGADEDRQTVAELVAASAAAARAMPPLSKQAVEQGARAFRRLEQDKPGHARAFSQLCHARAAYDDGWNTLDFCVAFDEAAFINAAKDHPPNASAAYFVSQRDGSAHAYIYKVSSVDAIENRLMRIRALVSAAQPPPPRSAVGKVWHGIAKRGGKLADAAWKAIGLNASSNRSAHDF